MLDDANQPLCSMKHPQPMMVHRLLVMIWFFYLRSLMSPKLVFQLRQRRSIVSRPGGHLWWRLLTVSIWSLIKVYLPGRLLLLKYRGRLSGRSLFVSPSVKGGVQPNRYSVKKGLGSGFSLVLLAGLSSVLDDLSGLWSSVFCASLYMYIIHLMVLLRRREDYEFSSGVLQAYAVVVDGMVPMSWHLLYLVVVVFVLSAYQALLKDADFPEDDVELRVENTKPLKRAEIKIVSLYLLGIYPLTWLWMIVLTIKESKSGRYLSISPSVRGESSPHALTNLYALGKGLAKGCTLICFAGVGKFLDEFRRLWAVLLYVSVYLYILHVAYIYRRKEDFDICSGFLQICFTFFCGICPTIWHLLPLTALTLILSVYNSILKDGAFPPPPTNDVMPTVTGHEKEEVEHEKEEVEAGLEPPSPPAVQNSEDAVQNSENAVQISENLENAVQISENSETAAPNSENPSTNLQDHVSSIPSSAVNIPTRAASNKQVDVLTDISSADHALPVDAVIVNTTKPSSSTAADSNPETEQLGFGFKKKQPPVKLADYVTSLIYTPSPSATPYPIDNFVSSSQFSDTYRAYLFAITSGNEPRNYQEDIVDENWRYVVKDEIEALEENGTWTVEDLPQGKKAIGCKWVFRLKFNADGTLERHKARHVVLGNNQKEGIDYSETFAPVAKMITVRAFLQQAASLDWQVHQMDVYNMFLHGDLNEEVYMKFPPGFRTNDDTKVCRLRKSLYGLKQAPRCWFAKLGSALKSYGFEQDVSDYSLFILAKGIEVACSPAGIYLCQRKYALEIIAEAGLMGVKPITFPLEQNHKLSLAKDGVFPDLTRYRRLVGRLIYLGNTRPELSYAIHILSQFMNEPQHAHWNAALRVVRYLKNSPGQGILLRANTPLILTAWCDSDHGACPLTQRSLTGWFIQLGDSPLSWKTRKHDVVSRSSAEAEYRAMANTVSELLWLRELLPTLGVEVTAPITLYYDSLSAIMLAANPVFHARTNHVCRDVHFVRDEIIRGVIATKHVNTKSQLADIMTKALGRQQFEDFLVKLGVCNLHTPP
ncbi:Reverse transcriptase RNA-dependent DNA polymerase [Arabidopsis thaliana x Arabidopsis arenosa]|uniref:Reverse transcriptase RNA-dependent DNA polymerase n=1 Tax=Arabidopsis thaliana x Arabidopsis arenosa TaxID=1240361 RepID=A0A8T1ZMH2_9BRAS|nr:Reverse transcriptase RNA-dependent DNA polymerase [Arabidopsis thaliana x Arabidopsis arenosa]